MTDPDQGGNRRAATAGLVIAVVLLYNTYPVQLVNTGQSLAGEAVALSVVSLFITWLLLLVISFIGNRGASKARIGRLL